MTIYRCDFCDNIYTAKLRRINFTISNKPILFERFFKKDICGNCLSKITTELNKLHFKNE